MVGLHDVLLFQDVTPSTPGVSALEGSSHNVRSGIGPASHACAKGTIMAWHVTQECAAEATSQSGADLDYAGDPVCKTEWLVPW